MTQSASGLKIVDRSSNTPAQTIEAIWQHLQLPNDALPSVTFSGSGFGLPSSFKIGHLAQSTVALSGLAASLIRSIRHKSAVAKVTVDLRHACAEYKSIRLYIIDGKRPASGWGPLGGLYPTPDGYVRLHDSFPNHRKAALEILGVPATATREDVSRVTRSWRKVDLEIAAHHDNGVIAALRTYAEWDALPQASAIRDMPVSVRRIGDAPTGRCPGLSRGAGACLKGLLVLVLSCVIAAPLVGRILAAHGADVLWVTSPNLPDQTELDRDLAHGKRSIRLDVRGSKRESGDIT